MSKEEAALKDNPDWQAFKKQILEEKKHPSRFDAVWIKDAIGRKVEVYCSRAPSVHGVLRKVDERFGKILVQNDDETVEISLSGVVQVRYPKK